MELTSKMKKEMNFAERDKTYIPHQEKLPVVAYQILKNLVGFIVSQHLRIKELEKEKTYERH